MTDLADFLLARIAEDEEAYRTAMHMGCVEDESDGPSVIHSATCPNRVLAECDAKRRIVELHKLGGTYEPNDFDYCGTCGSGEPYEYPTPWPCETLRLIALPYADHPDYDERWRP